MRFLAWVRCRTKRSRFAALPEDQQNLTARFLVACQSGNVQELTAVLAQDVVSWSDGGDKVTTALRPIYGRERVIRMILGLLRKRPADYVISAERVNGAPALLGWINDQLSDVFSFEMARGQIQHIRTVRNPEKLAYLQRQLQMRDGSAQPSAR